MWDLLEDAIQRIKSMNPRLITFCVYGENVNSGTTQMSGAVRLTNSLKENGVDIPISFVGSHVQALPYKVLSEEKNIDFILPKKKPLIAGSIKPDTSAKKSKYYSKKDFSLAKKAVTEMKKSKCDCCEGCTCDPCNC